MSKEEIYNEFKRMFPAYSEHVTNYKKLGSKMISLQMDNPLFGSSLVFLYDGKNNWNFGTKPWRRKPIPVKKTSQEKQSV